MSKKRSRPTENQIAPFINSLWTMVNDTDNHDHINWVNRGKAIKVRDPPQFAQKIIPKYFKHKNIPSFVRQLNLYGFKKTRQDPNFLEFQHEFFVKGRQQDLQKCTRKRNKLAAKKQKQSSGAAPSPSSSSSSSFSTRYIVPGTTPEDFATQREALDKLLKDMAAVHQHQSEMSQKVAQLQQENAELKDANQVLQSQAVDAEQQQHNMKGRLQETFHFMIQLWEQFKSEGGRLGNASNAKRLPFIDMQRRPVIQAIEDHRSLDRTTPQASSSSTSSRLASAMRDSGHRVTTPRSISRSNSEVRPLRRLTSRDASFFSNPGTSSVTAYDDLEASLDALGMLSEPIESPATSSTASTSIMGAPRSLSRATRQQSFITNSPLGGLSGPSQVYQETGNEMNSLHQRQDELDVRLNTLQRGLSDVLQADSFQQLLQATPLFTDPSNDN
jgi:hypothetical protein